MGAEFLAPDDNMEYQVKSKNMNKQEEGQGQPLEDGLAGEGDDPAPGGEEDVGGKGAEVGGEQAGEGEAVVKEEETKEKEGLEEDKQQEATPDQPATDTASQKPGAPVPGPQPAEGPTKEETAQQSRPKEGPSEQLAEPPEAVPEKAQPAPPTKAAKPEELTEIEKTSQKIQQDCDDATQALEEKVAGQHP